MWFIKQLDELHHVTIPRSYTEVVQICGGSTAEDTTQSLWPMDTCTINPDSHHEMARLWKATLMFCLTMTACQYLDSRRVRVHCCICVYIKATELTQSSISFCLVVNTHTPGDKHDQTEYIHTYVRMYVCIILNTPHTAHSTATHLTLTRSHSTPNPHTTNSSTLYTYVHTYTQHGQHFLHLFLTRIVYSYVPAPPTLYMSAHSLLYPKHKRLNRLQSSIERQACVMCAYLSHLFFPSLPTLYLHAHSLHAPPTPYLPCPLLTCPSHSLHAPPTPYPLWGVPGSWDGSCWWLQ